MHNIVIMDKDSERFRCALFPFCAFVLGFKKGCRPLLFLVDTHSIGKYGGSLLGATSKDGNNVFFHVAFAIIDNKTYDIWTWFLTTLGMRYTKTKITRRLLHSC